MSVAQLRMISWWRIATGGLALGVVLGMIVWVLGIPRRWVWWTESPNDLGAILAAALPILVGLLARCGWGQGESTRWWVVVPCFLGTSVAICGLVGSCSRGGICAAVFAGFVLALLVSGLARRLVLVGLVALTVTVMIAPRAGARMAIDPTKDQSIATRISLMRASAMMIADRPTGWGAHEFGDACECWYLDRVRGISLWHPLNDTLWLGTERGIFAMAAFLALSLALAAGLAHMGRSGDPLAAGIAAGCLAILAAGCTTGLLRPGGVPWTMAGFALISLGYWTSGVRNVTTAGWRWIAMGGCAGLLATVGCWGMGAYLATSWPYRPGVDSTLAAAPRKDPRAFTVAVIQNGDDSPTAICRQVLRPLVDHGFAAVCLTEATFATWPGRTAPHILLVLRGVINDRPVPQLMQTGTRGIVFLDLPSDSLPIVAPTCPVLLMTGSAEAEVPPIAWKSVATAHKESRVVAAQVPFCWPRHFSKLSESVSAWMRRIAKSARDPAG